MPLSDHEQRILQEIEQRFYEHDRQFADKIKSETVSRHAGRNCKWAGLAFVVGLVVLVTTFSASLILGVIGFVIMLVSATVFERNLRRFAKAGRTELMQSVRKRGLPNGLVAMRKNVRDRFRRKP